MMVKSGRIESTSWRRRRVRSTTGGAMCGSDAWTKLNVRGAGAACSANVSSESAAAGARQNDPMPRYPFGIDTKTMPVGPRSIRATPEASVVTTSR